MYGCMYVPAFCRIPEDKGSIFLSNAATYLADYMVSRALSSGI
jgi:hypothetical protein